MSEMRSKESIIGGLNVDASPSPWEITVPLLKVLIDIRDILNERMPKPVKIPMVGEPVVNIINRFENEKEEK